MDQAAFVVLDVGDGRAVLFLPAEGKQAIAQWHDVNGDDLVRANGPSLILKCNWVSGSNVRLTWKSGYETSISRPSGNDPVTYSGSLFLLAWMPG